MSVTTGTNVTFKVQATGDYLHFQWQKDCIDLSDDDKYQDTDTDTLHILKVEKSDSKASYRCHIKNDADEKFSKQAVLTVSKLIIAVNDMYFTCNQTYLCMVLAISK